MFNAIRHATWNAEPDHDIVLDAVSVKQDDPPVCPKQERGNQIIQDLMNGKADRVICHDEIDAETQLWSCKSCHHIYHFTCIKAWAEKKGTFTWPCPTCKTLQVGKASNMVPSCWCGRRLQEKLSYTGNSCGAICFKPNKCTGNPTAPCLSNCSKVCHPGPCEPVVCNDWCPSQRDKPFGRTPATANMSPVEYHRQMNRVERQEAGSQQNSASGSREFASVMGAQRLVPDEDGHANLPERNAKYYSRRAIWAFVGLIIITAPFLYWMISRIDRLTRPLEHRHFTEKMRGKESGLTIAAVVVLTPFFGIIGLALANCASKAIFMGFNISRFSLGTKLIIYLLAICFAAALSLDVFVLAAAGPHAAWKDQMKDSCRGFDTRVKLDNQKDYGSSSIPSSSFTLYVPDTLEEPIRQIGIDEFKMTVPVEKSKLSTDPFYSYHRMTGTLSPEIHVAINFDLYKHMWRIMNLTCTSPPNPNSNDTTLPQGTTEAIFKTGTWTQTTRDNPHVLIPEISLQIPNMHYFTTHCVYQPFMKVYSTSGLSPAQITKQGIREWSPKNEKEVVMRTAAFGYYPDNLQVCARRADYEAGGQKMKGLREDVVVPLGLIAALRLQMKTDGRFKNGCSYTLS
ncbi:uncharacterized protein PAC_14890 [Phialocephala subalpina]|uniref:RING-type domain-containing protein n=1 Tax=Phialocephala subalpina TaxID=576137 RepID=A0A1L7XIX7_9HELO|nr:uncharacterized protein PAC_14890 [Phialocephala subalpina]